MALHVLSSELKWLLITFIIALQEGQTLLPADSFFFLVFLSLIWVCVIRPGRYNLKNSLLTFNLESKK